MQTHIIFRKPPLSSSHLNCSPSSSMATKAALVQEIDNIIAYMEQQGLVDHHLRMVRSLRNANGPFFFMELITRYCSDSDVTIRHITTALEQPVVDFNNLRELCFKLKGGSSCIGAYRMAQACAEFRSAIDNNAQDRFVMTLNLMKYEFSMLRDNLSLIVELERKVLSFGSSDS